VKTHEELLSARLASSHGAAGGRTFSACSHRISGLYSPAELAELTGDRSVDAIRAITRKRSLTCNTRDADYVIREDDDVYEIHRRKVGLVVNDGLSLVEPRQFVRSET
jgi:hypothetical protein